jgi:cathepsin B
MGASEVLSDRYCIKGNKVQLSPQYMVNCDYNNYACLGGYLSKTWYYLENYGIPTEQCVKYISGAGYFDECSAICDDGSTPTFYKAKYAKNFTTVSAIQLEVMNNGPIEAGMTVYNDFLAYKSGIYKHITGSLAGGHAVKIVGWGEQNGINYWICANSWGTTWGENGFFRIAFGECGIDLQGIVGVPAI